MLEWCLRRSRNEEADVGRGRNEGPPASELLACRIDEGNGRPITRGRGPGPMVRGRTPSY